MNAPDILTLLVSEKHAVSVEIDFNGCLAGNGEQ